MPSWYRDRGSWNERARSGDCPCMRRSSLSTATIRPTPVPRWKNCCGKQPDAEEPRHGALAHQEQDREAQLRGKKALLIDFGAPKLSREALSGEFFRLGVSGPSC